MMGQGAMGQGAMGSGMMNHGMQGQGMMGDQAGMDSAVMAKQLESMPPFASFMHVTQTCSACHTDFRAKEK
ncbi:MAG: cytochrome c, partial [Rhodospirillales bacterium]